MVFRSNSIREEGLKSYINRRYPLIGYAVFDIAVENGVSIASLCRLLGKKDKPVDRNTIKYYKQIRKEGFIDGC